MLGDKFSSRLNRFYIQALLPLHLRQVFVRQCCLIVLSLDGVEWYESVRGNGS